MASIDVEDAAADRRPPPGRQAGDGVEQDLLVVGRRLDDLGEAGERDDADLGGRALALDEPTTRRPRPPQPAGRDVGGAHAPRDVDREDDRGLAGGHADDRRPAGRSPARGSPSASTNSANGRWRRMRDERGRAIADQRQAGVAHARTGVAATARSGRRRGSAAGEQQEDQRERRQEVASRQPSEPAPARLRRRPAGPAGRRPRTAR